MTDMDPSNSSALARLRYELAFPPFHAVLKPEAVTADEAAGMVVVKLPYQPVLRRSPDESYFHGGVIAALIDCVGHAAVAVRAGRMVPTIDLRIDYLRPASGKALEARGRVQRFGRTTAVADVEVRGEGDVIVALGRGLYSTRATGSNIEK